MSASQLASMPPAEAVIPHRGAALLIERVLRADGTRLVAALTVRPGTAFSDPDGTLPAWMAPEIMAQAIAAYAGCKSLAERGSAAPLGLLLGVRHLRVALERFAPGDELQVEVLCTSSDEEGRGVFDCELRTAAAVAATATLTVFQPQDARTLQTLLEAG